MPEVISNTTPILSLLRINKLHLLRELYTTVTIPLAVFKEIENGRKKAFYKDLSKFNWIIIKKIKNSASIDRFIELDDGEAEVLILANELHADLVLMDELIRLRNTIISQYQDIPRKQTFKCV